MLALSKSNSVPDSRVLDVRQMVSDASRRVREFKRIQAGRDDDFSKNEVEPMGAGFEEQSKLQDLTSMGDALEWSPKASTKRKKKGFVRLTSYENQCFSSQACGV